MPVLGVLPKYEKEVECFETRRNQESKSAMSEALRSIRTNLEFLSNKRKLRMSITSTVSGEGKLLFQ